MKHVDLKMRGDWQKKLEEDGFTYHSLEGVNDKTPYWLEGKAYEFREYEIKRIQEATEELHDMCMSVADDMITKGDYPKEYNFTSETISLIESSYKKQKNDSMYGRMDLYYDNDGKVKLYEYNADTPLTLVESSEAQKNWLKDMIVMGELDSNYTQYNNIKDNLVEYFKKIKNDVIHFTLYTQADKTQEDFDNIKFIAKCAELAGKQPFILPLHEIGYDNNSNMFVDNGKNLFHYNEIMNDLKNMNKKIDLFHGGFDDELFGMDEDEEEFAKMLNSDNSEIKLDELSEKYNYLINEFGVGNESDFYNEIKTMYKLYPIEYMLEDEFIKNINKIQLIEPIWKGLIISNKCILVELWKKFKNHPYLLEAKYEEDKSFVKKPKLAREGADIILPNNSELSLSSDEFYKKNGYIYQEYCKPPLINDYYPIIGSWIINNKAAGLNMRIDKNIITGVDAHFVPHYIR